MGMTFEGMTMLARLWTTHIDPAQHRAYEAFSNTYSAAMFAALPGCLGAFFMGTGDQRWVLSLWRDAASIDALKNSVLYCQTVDRFVASGILREPQTVEVFELTGGMLNDGVLRETMLALTGR
jgi:hypothetical protein